MNVKLYLKKTERKGNGVFTKSKILKKDTVLIFTGTLKQKPEKYTLQIGPKKHLYVENIGKFLNHSCDPNCIVVNSIFLKAEKEILPDEEITFDYSTTEAHFSLNCFCDSKNCRKKVVGYADKNP